MSKHSQKFENESNYSDMYHAYIHIQKNVKVTFIDNESASGTNN